MGGEHSVSLSALCTHNIAHRALVFRLLYDGSAEVHHWLYPGEKGCMASQYCKQISKVFTKKSRYSSYRAKEPGLVTSLKSKTDKEVHVCELIPVK